MIALRSQAPEHSSTISRRTRRWLAAGAVVVAGCEFAPQKATQLATMTVLVPGGEEQMLGPAWDDDAKMLVFLPLVRYEEYYGGSAPKPAAAARWEPSPDYRTWTIHTNSAVRWHDGVPLTARDLAFTIALWKNPDANYWAGPGYGDVSVVDDSTLTITYQRPTRHPLGGWDVFYPEHALAKLPAKSFEQWDFWTRPIGNGPFRYVRHTPKTSIELQANPDFHLGKPRIDRLILKFGGGVPLNELLGGGVDVARIEGAQVQRVESDKRFRVYHDLAPARYQVFWNHRDPLFRETAVRKALTMAIDRRTLHRMLDFPPSVPLFDGICTGRQFRNSQCGAALPYDTAAARLALENAGWRDSNGDGVREKDGRAFTFTLLVESQNDRVRTAVFVQEQLRRVGVAAEIKQLESGIPRQRVLQGEFQAALALIPNSPGHHLTFFGKKSPLGYGNARVPVLLDSAMRSVDPDEVDRIYTTLGQIFAEEVPVTYLYPRVTFFAVTRRIRGLVSPFRANPVWGAERLWIDDGS